MHPEDLDKLFCLEVSDHMFLYCAVRDTRAAEGPNSFSKGKLGFCNQQKVMMRELEENTDKVFKK